MEKKDKGYEMIEAIVFTMLIGVVLWYMGKLVIHLFFKRNCRIDELLEDEDFLDDLIVEIAKRRKKK